MVIYVGDNDKLLAVTVHNANGLLNDSALYGCQYSKVELVSQSDNTYRFTGLEQGTSYPISVRVTSSVGKTTTTNVTESTVAMTSPTYTEAGVYPKTVTIHFPEGCADGTLTCTYQKDNGTTETVTSTTAQVSFDNHGTIAAYVSDGVSTVNSSYTVTIRLKAADLSYDNTNTGMDCVDAQCALDAIKKMLE